MNGRKIDLDILYNNQNITTEIEDFVSAISFSDNLSGQADELSLTLGDRQKRWINQWIPKMGANIEASILVSAGWGHPSGKRKLGHYEIVDLSTSGPPNKLTIKSTTLPESSSLRGTKKSKAWEKTNLKKIAGDIASKSGLSLFYSVQENPTYDRVDQESQVDIGFLSKLCTDAGLSVKINDKSLIILDDYNLENKETVHTFSINDANLKTYGGVYKQTGIYKSCRVSYTNTTQKKTYTAIFTPKKPPSTDRILEVNEEVASQAAAQTLAKKKLREANKEATTFSIRWSGILNLYAGQTVMLKGFGAFDGKYIITSVSGTIGSGSETSFDLRKCLEGY